jgi:hypothetical protein
VRAFQFGGENLFTAENAKYAEKFKEKTQRSQCPQRLIPGVIKKSAPKVKYPGVLSILESLV